METQGDPKNPTKFYCEKCDYSTSHKNDFGKHCQTMRHRVSNLETQGDPKFPKCPSAAYSCENCNKTYYSYSGLCKHKKTCKEVTQVTLLEFMQKQTDFMQKNTEAVQKHNGDVYKVMMELCKTMQINASNNVLIQNSTNTNVCNNNNNNNNNTTFNLQFFLNETCKDALNIDEFIRGVKVDFEDIERIGNMGYVDGISDVIMRNLNALGVNKRPIHCTYAKRNTIYIKEDNIWTKEDEDIKRLQFLVDCIQRANLKVLAKWREKFPSCLLSNSMYTDSYNKMSHELMGGDCINTNMTEKDNKIIQKIAKCVIIDKKSLLDY
jgi:hypothetical protein